MKMKFLLYVVVFFFCLTSTYSQDEAIREVFKVVEQMPRFPGCEHIDWDNKEKEGCAKQKMLEYIYGNLIYPAEAKENEIEGMTVVQFIVSKTGEVTEVNLVRDIGYGCGDAAVTVVESMNQMDQKWVSGAQRGRPVEVLYTLPVKFKLNSKDIIIKQFDETLESPRLVVLNNLVNGKRRINVSLVKKRRSSQKIKYDDRDFFKVKKGKFMYYENLESRTYNLFVGDADGDTDDVAFVLHATRGVTTYLMIDEADDQGYILKEISPEKAKEMMASMKKE